MSQKDAQRARKLRRLLESRLILGQKDHRWDDYDADELIAEAQEELLDAVLYLEKLREKLEGTHSS